jgi:hypothetical protein
MRPLSHRIARLEAMKKTAVVVVSGYSEHEHERAITHLIANGAATDRDLFVCLMRFGKRATRKEASGEAHEVPTCLSVRVQSEARRY